MFVLGISGALGHDAAACLMRDGDIVAMVEEERLVRSSHAFHRLPLRSVEYCLNSANITLDEVDYIAISWDENLFETHFMEQKYTNIHDIFPKSLFPHRVLPKVEVVDHHLSHAASAYYCSGFHEAAILVIDGSGENCSTSTYYGKGNSIRKLKSLHQTQSLGEFYNAVSEYLGFDWIDAGKTMGLASYGEPAFDFRKISLNDGIGYHIDVDRNTKFSDLPLYWRREILKLGINPNVRVRKYNSSQFQYIDELEFSKEHMDLASSAQRKLEECYESIVRNLVRVTKTKNVCIAGGVGLNCVANGKIASSDIVDNLFIQPASGDAGTALGAAAAVSINYGGKVKILQSVFYGPSYSNDEVIACAEHLGITYRVLDDVSEAASDYIASGNIVGWFQGKSEFGPRALGNRSILANPSAPGIRDKVNVNVKYRETFRPFGPSIMGDKAHDWFEPASESPFMLKSFQVKRDKMGKIDGVTHIDGSSRPQTVSPNVSPRYYGLINEFYKKTGIPMVLNTSFNLRGEPMVCSPYDALRTFYTSALDVLILNDIMVEKRNTRI